jgi:hypothetical protein
MTEAVPIIVMSGGFQLSNDGVNQRDIDDLLYIAEDLGATRTISKPFSCGDLLAVIGECLREVRAGRRDPVVEAGLSSDAEGGSGRYFSTYAVAEPSRARARLHAALAGVVHSDVAAARVSFSHQLVVRHTQRIHAFHR